MDWIKVQGNSMCPFLLPGDEIAVDWKAAHSTCLASSGELVLGRDASHDWIVHRVIDWKDGCDPEIKGDAAFCWDHFSSGEVWAKVVAIRPQGLGQEIPLSRTLLDFLIARVSRHCLPPERLKSRILRRVVFAMGLFRRKLL